MRLIGIGLWVVGLAIFLFARTQAKVSVHTRIGAVSLMIAGVFIATWEWFYEFAKRNGSLNHVTGAIGGLCAIGLGFVFLYDTRQALTSKAKSRRRIAIFVIATGAVVVILELLH
jgi:hypothetical protein